MQPPAGNQEKGKLLGCLLLGGSFACCGRFGLEALAVDGDLVDADLDEVLTVALHLLVLLLALQLEDQDLVAAALAEHGAGDFGAGQVGGELAGLVADGDDVGELDGAVGVGGALELQLLTRGDDVLLAAGTNHCIHRKTSCAVVSAFCLDCGAGGRIQKNCIGPVGPVTAKCLPVTVPESLQLKT